jgi:hypothetical protein
MYKGQYDIVQRVPCYLIKFKIFSGRYCIATPLQVLP